MLKKIEITEDNLYKSINRLSLSEKLIKSDYSENFYLHLTSLLNFHLAITRPDYVKFKLNETKYIGLEQFILENSGILEEEEEEIDWDLIDNVKDILSAKLKNLLGQEFRSDYIKPFVKSTLDLYEKWLIYKLMHPTSVYNPWIQTLNIIEKGYLFFISDDEYKLKEYDKKIYTSINKEIYGNIGLITKSKKQNFSGFIVDNRHNSQLSVLEYLEKYGKGIENAISLKKIRQYMQDQIQYIKENELRTKIMIPLKRTGLIGSYSKGYFYISSIEDLKYSYKTHLQKFKGLQKTLQIYEKRANSFGIRNLSQNII